MERPRISAVITTFNEERNVAACVESLLWCDEVVVVDSFSTDRTPEIARSYGKVRFLQRKYFGSASQKNWAMDQAQHEWILILDADERCTPELQAEIEATIRDPRGTEAFIITRRVFFMDRVIRFSGWQHDRVVRLVKRGAGRYPNKRVHTDMKTRGPARVLRQPMPSSRACIRSSPAQARRPAWNRLAWKARACCRWPANIPAASSRRG